MESQIGKELEVKDATVGWRIPKDYSQEEIDFFTNALISSNWIPVDTYVTIGFISPCRTWFQGYQASGRVCIDMSIESARRLGFCAKQEEIVEASKTEMS